MASGFHRESPPNVSFLKITTPVVIFAEVETPAWERRSKKSQSCASMC